MVPNYHNLEFALIDKHSDVVQCGDVIAFRCPSVKATLIKRIVAVPGDTVLIQDGVLLVNGKPSSVVPTDAYYAYSGTATDTITLDTDEYFVLGDNYSVSKDSRYENIGLVHSSEILGPVLPQKPAN